MEQEARGQLKYQDLKQRPDGFPFFEANDAGQLIVVVGEVFCRAEVEGEIYPKKIHYGKTAGLRKHVQKHGVGVAPVPKRRPSILEVVANKKHLQILMQYAHEYRAQRANGHQHTNEDQTQHANGVQANDDSQISITDDANEHRTKGTKDSPLSISDESD